MRSSNTTYTITRSDTRSVYIRTTVPPHPAACNRTEPTSLIPLLFSMRPSYHTQARTGLERIQIYTRWIIMITGVLDPEWLAMPVLEASPWCRVRDQGRVSDLANIQGAWTDSNQSEMRKIKEGDRSVCSTVQGQYSLAWKPGVGRRRATSEARAGYVAGIMSG